MEIFAATFAILYLITQKSAEAASTIGKENKLTPNVEDQFFSDFVSVSVPNRLLNFMFVGTGLNTVCVTSTCEKFSAVNLEESLYARGYRMNVRQDPTFHHFGPIRNINAGSRKADVVVLKFISFSEEERKMFALVKKYDLKSYTAILTEHYSTFNMVKEYLLDKQINNVYVIRKSGAKRYTIYSICAYCKSGTTELSWYTSWGTESGFLKELTFDSSFKGGFFGATIKVGLLPSPPSYFEVGKNEDGSSIYGGNEYWMLQLLSKYLKFKFIVTHPTDGFACRDNDHKPGGFCKMLLTKEVQLAGFSYNINNKNFHYYDPTYIYFQINNAIISANVRLTTKMGSLTELVEPAVLIFILVTFILSFVLYWMIAKYWYSEDETLTNIFLVFFAIMLLEGVRIYNQKLSKELIVGIWMVACMFIIALVFGEITSIAASPALGGIPVNSVEDMVNRDISWVSVPFWHTDFYLSLNPKVAELKKRKKIMPEQKGLEFVLANPESYVYYSAKRYIDPVIRTYFWNGKDRNPFYFSPPIEGDPQWMETVLVAKDAPYRDAVTMKLLQMEACGVYRQKFVVDGVAAFGKESKAKASSDDDSFKAFGLDRFLIGIIMWLFGLGFSFLVFSFEVCVHKIYII